VEEGVGREVEADAEAVERIVRETTGSAPRALRFIRTDGGLVAHLTLGLDSAETLTTAHDFASTVEQRIHDALPEIADVVVHTEP
jgi:divalent metal cation (Fe/Co/Zn/Cd) transporter